MNFLFKLARLLAVAGAFAAMTTQPAVAADPYPNRPIRVVVGYAPGGSADAGICPLANRTAEVARGALFSKQ